MPAPGLPHNAHRVPAPCQVGEIAAVRPGTHVRGPGGEWIGLVGGTVVEDSTPTHLLVVLTIRDRQAPVEAAISVTRVRSVGSAGVVIDLARDAVMAYRTGRDSSSGRPAGG